MTTARGLFSSWETLARKECEQGVLLMDLCGKLIRGEPIAQTKAKLLPRWLRTPERIYEEVVVPYYPTIEDRKWARPQLAERGWGKAPQVVSLEEGETQGFTIIHRRWAPGTEPFAEAPGRFSQAVVDLLAGQDLQPVLGP